MYLILIMVLVSIDQLTKLLIYNSLGVFQSIPIIDNVFHITYVKNFGAAFNIFQGKTNFLIVITIAIIIGAIIYLILKHKVLQPMIKVSMSLIISGGIGNIIDRCRVGFVVDFLDFRHFPVFNFADICVTTGCALLIIHMILSERWQKNEH